MLGITGASGAPYAARVLRALVASGADVGVVVSRAGAQVIALELYGDRDMNGPTAPSSGSSPTTATPTSADLGRVGLLGALRLGLEPHRRRHHLPMLDGHRRHDRRRRRGQPDPPRRRPCSSRRGARLVLVPRETPLSDDPPREPAADPKRARASVVPAMPGFYHLPQSIDDLVDFVAGRVLDTAGVEADPVRALGERDDAPARPGARDVRPDLAVVRPHEPGDEHGHGRALAGPAAVPLRGLEPGEPALDVCCGTGDLAIELAVAVGSTRAGSSASTSRSGCSRRRAPSGSQVEWLQGDALGSAVRDGEFDACHGRVRRPQPADIERGFREMARVVRPGGRVVCLEMSQPPRSPRRSRTALDRPRRAAAGPRAGARRPTPTATCRRPCTGFPPRRRAGRDHARRRPRPGAVPAPERAPSPSTSGTVPRMSLLAPSSRSAAFDRPRRGRGAAARGGRRPRRRRWPPPAAARSRPAASGCGRCWCTCARRRPARDADRPRGRRLRGRARAHGDARPRRPARRARRCGAAGRRSGATRRRAGRDIHRRLPVRPRVLRSWSRPATCPR